MKWWTEFRESTKQTKYFVLTWLFYGLIIILSCIYSYARLDYVRSSPYSAAKQSIKSEKPSEPSQQPPAPNP